MSKDLIERLRPLGEGFVKEPFDAYKLRVASELSNFPECALENWIYRHYSQINDYSFLGFEKMVFNDELWSKEDIFNNIKSYYPDMIDTLGYQIYERHDKTWLQKYSIGHGMCLLLYTRTTHIQAWVNHII